MSENEDLPAMDDELRGLLRRGAPQDGVPPGADLRLFARLATTLPLVPPPGGGGTDRKQDRKHDGERDGGRSTSSSSAGAAGAGGLVSGKIAALVALAAIVGGGAGAAVTSAVSEPKVRTVYVDRLVPAASSSVSGIMATTSSSTPASDLSPAATETPRATVSAGASANADDAQMSTERSLLDVARASFARGEHDRALTALERHKARYPSGLLAEEREALAVRTLVALGRSKQAHERGQRFLARYPESLMRPAVEGALNRERDAN